MAPNPTDLAGGCCKLTHGPRNSTFKRARDILVKNRNIISRLSERIRLLERENAQLKKEVEFFRRTPTLAQGLKGETLIANLTGGVRTGCKDPHDVTVKSGDRLEVKYSHLNVPNRYGTKRWNWHSFRERKE